MIKKSQTIAYLTPAVLLTVTFYIVPLVYLCFTSFFQWNGLGPKIYVGIDNFLYVFSDPVFKKAFLNTILWILSALLLHIPLGLLLALLLNKQPAGWKFMRVMYFIPNVISTTAVAFLWYFIYHVDVGLLNNILRNVGLGSLAKSWLGNINTALLCNQVPFILYVGLTMIIFMTQLSAIPAEIYRAAEIDGASPLQKDLYISVPLLKNAVITNILLNAAFCLRTFEYPFLMTSGGPANSTINLSLYIYKEMMIANRYGISMVAGIVTVVMGLILMGLVSHFSGDRKETA